MTLADVAEQSLRGGDPVAALAQLAGAGARQSGRPQAPRLPVPVALRARPVGPRAQPAGRRIRASTLAALAMRQIYGDAVHCEATRTAGVRRQALADDLRAAGPVAGPADRVAAAARAAASTRDRTSCGPGPSTTPRPRLARSTGGPSRGLRTPTRGSDRCSRPSSTAGTTGCRFPV